MNSCSEFGFFRASPHVQHCARAITHNTKIKQRICIFEQNRLFMKWVCFLLLWTKLCFYIYENIPLVLLGATFLMIVELYFDLTTVILLPYFQAVDFVTTKALLNKSRSTNQEHFSLLKGVMFVPL